MKRFEKYPIYINHPGRWYKERDREYDYFSDKYAEKPNPNDLHMMKWLGPAGDGWRLFEIMDDQHTTPESWHYEYDVYQLLRLISSTRIGKLLLDSLNQNQQYWIVPKDNFGVDCGCQAVTFPATPKAHGGIRVYFTPSEHRPVEERFESADDILFHELVHAYRIGQVGFCGQNQKKFVHDTNNMNAEEFLAVHMQNVYLSNRGSKRFYRDVISQKSVSKGTAYEYFSEDVEILMAFRWFVDHDPCLAPTVAQWAQPADSFNPWRDQPHLERLFLANAEFMTGVKRLPDFGYVSPCY